MKFNSLPEKADTFVLGLEMDLSVEPRQPKSALLDPDSRSPEKTVRPVQVGVPKPVKKAAATGAAAVPSRRVVKAPTRSLAGEKAKLEIWRQLANGMKAKTLCKDCYSALCGECQKVSTPPLSKTKVSRAGVIIRVRH